LRVMMKENLCKVKGCVFYWQLPNHILFSLTFHQMHHYVSSHIGSWVRIKEVDSVLSHFPGQFL
jgi:hypothetical protein